MSVDDSEMVDVTVVIPCRNDADVLPTQLDALVAQETGRPFEVLVADNGSGDELDAVISAYTERLRIRRVDASARRGAGAARNIAIGEARGVIILFLDADDRASTAWLERMADELAATDMVGGGISFDFEHGMAPAVWRPSGGWLPFAIGANMGARRDCLVALGGFDERFLACQDQELSWRAQVLGHSFTMVHDAIVYRRVRGDLRSLWRQQFRYGHFGALVFREFHRHGRRRELLLASKRYAWLVCALPSLLVPSKKRTWVEVAATCVGRASGSVRFQVFFP